MGAGALADGIGLGGASTVAGGFRATLGTVMAGTASGAGVDCGAEALPVVGAAVTTG